MLGTEITTNKVMGTIGSGLDGNPVSAYQFDADNERDTVRSSHIRNLKAAKITAGTLDSSVIYGGTITGGQITGGTILGTVVYAGTLNADQIGSGTLPVGVIYGGTINANLITGGTMSAGKILGIVVTGGTVQTADGGERVVLNGSNQYLEFYNSSDVRQMVLHDYSMDGLRELNWDTSSSDPDTNGRLVFRKSGSNYYMRMKMGSTVEQFDTHTYP